MIEDALLEAQKLDEGFAQAATGVANKMVNGVKNMFSGGNKNNGGQQGQQTQNGGDQNAQQDNGTQQQEEAADPGIDKIKEYLNDNDDISDWPADRLGELVAFLKTQKDFMNSKTAQAELQAIQQQEQKAEAEGKTEAPADGGKGNADNVAKQQQDANQLTAILGGMVNKGAATKDDIIAWVNANIK